MAHFAKLDSNNHVTQVIVIDDLDIKDAAGVEQESLGVTFCQNHCGDGSSVWKQTSYNKNIRGHYAGIGMTYMSGVRTLGVASTDIFISPQPYPSWSIGINTANWYPPDPPGSIPALTDSEFDAGKMYIWNESNYNSNPSTAWVLTDPS